jgi:uncharacterized repeat protein (TIGR01451 family)
MNRWSLVLALVVMGGFGPLARADDDVLLVKQFERAYPGPSPLFNGMAGLTPARDGGFFFLVWGDNNELLAIKTDRNGYVEWQTGVQYGPPGAPKRVYEMRLTDSVKQTPDGGFIFGGAMRPGISNPGGSDPSDGFMIRLDAHGNKVWETVIGTPGHDRPSPIEVAPDGGFVTAGFSVIAGKWRASLAKVSDSGQVLWHKHYAGFTGNFEDIAVTHGNDGYVLGGTDTGGVGVLLRTDLQGNAVRQLYLPAREFTYIFRVQRVPHGGYIVAGAASPKPWVLSLSKRDDNLNAEWHKTYSDHVGVWDLAHGLDVAEDGLLVAGTATFGGAPYAPFLLHTDWSGNIIKASKFARTLRLGAIFSTPGHGYVAGGQIQASGSRTDAYVARFKELREPGYIAGALYGDENLSCSADENEGPVGYQLMKAVDQEGSAYWGLIGGTTDYSLAVPPGNYTVSLADEKKSVEACGWDMSYSANVTPGAVSGGNDFFAQATCGGSLILTGQPSPTGGYQCPAGGAQGTPCAGYNWTFKVNLQNRSAARWNSVASSNGTPSTVCLNLPWTLNAADVRQEATSTCTGWTLSSVSPLCFTKQSGLLPTTLGCDIDVTVKVPAASVPPWTISAAADAYCGTQRALGDLRKEILYSTNQCSCDPNDLQVSPQGCGTEGAITGQELTYTARFQNVGAGPAHDVVIRDRLHEALEPSSLRVVSSSHRMTGVQVEPDNELVIRFDGIELPHEASDPQGSQGFVVFSIQPKKPYVDGTVIDNGAAIFFDSNPAVMTNKVVNTLYNGGPVPVADFRAVRRATGFDFSYTGGSTGISYQWNFGANATPAMSTDSHPSGVSIGGSGPYLVNLTVDKNGCTAATSQDVKACAGWGFSAFEPPMGKPRQLGATLPVKFSLSYQGSAVRSASFLESILEANDGWTPADGCWPRARVMTATGQEVPLSEEERCFRFEDGGKLLLNLKLDEGRFQRGQNYKVEVQNFQCALAPENNSFLLLQR